MFGATQSSFGGFGGFGSNTATQQPAFGAANTNTGFAFGQQQQPQTSSFGAFGAAATPSPFGQPQSQSSLFGSSAPSTTSTFGGFGTTNTNTSPFGQSTFGTLPQQSTFGAATNTNTGTGFSGFGQTQAQTGSGFAFGSNTGSSLFGSSTGTSTTTPFGQPQSQSSLFGSNTGSSMFGSSTTTSSPFGASTNTGISNPFGGAQQSQSSLFGSSSTQSTASPFGQTSLFGQQQTTAQSPFGATTNTAVTSSPFGGGFGGFGQQQQQPGQAGQSNAVTGTRTKRFEAMTEKSGVGDKATTVIYQTITAQPEYQNKSLEELRWEDTQLAGNGPLTSQGLTFPDTSTNTGFGFGQQQQSGSLFGGGQSGGLFGQTQPTTTQFGVSQPQSQSSLFGGNTGSSMFGSSTGQSFGGGLFGSTQSTSTPSFSLGGSTTNTTPAFGTGGGTLFGQTQAQPSLFGTTPSTSTTTPFGQPQSQTSLFGSNTGSSLFSGGSTLLFGQTQSTFATGSSLFGGQPQSSLTSNTGSSLFAGGSLFGPSTTQPTSSLSTPFSFNTLSSNTGSSLFGTQSQSSLTSQSVPSLFGGNTGSALFGGSTTMSSPFASSPFALTNTNTNAGGLFGGLGQQQQQQSSLLQPAQQAAPEQIARVDENPFLTNFLTSSTATLTSRTAISLSQSQASLSSQSALTASPSPSQSLLPSMRMSVGNVITPRSSARVGSAMARKSISLASPTTNILPSMNLMSNGSAGSLMTPVRGNGLIGLAGASPLSSSLLTLSNTASATPSQSLIPSQLIETKDLLIARRNTRKLHDVPTPTLLEFNANIPTHSHALSQSQSIERKDQYESLYPKLVEEERKESFSNGNNHSLPSYVPVLTNPDCYTVPSIHDLAGMSPSQLAAIPHFSVHHKQYGSVEWIAPVDVRYLNLDRLIVFSSVNGASSVEVDPEQDPERGEALNASAIVTLRQCWPPASSVSDPSKQQQKLKRYVSRLKETSDRAGAAFVSYQPETGEWKFRVEKFN